MLGLIRLANGPRYVSAKHSVLGVPRQVATDCAKGDSLHALCPGFVKSIMIDSLILTDMSTRRALVSGHVMVSIEARFVANSL
jgi:hypothetical protein